MKRFHVVLALCFLSAGFAHADAAREVTLQILAINDFHGNLEPPTGSQGKIAGIDAGGAEYLSTHLKALREGHAHSITVSAGDLFGASPLLSAMFKEKPTVLAMNLMGLDINAVGNHEFDKGFRELMKLTKGDSGENFAGAQFRFLAANVVVNDTGKTLFSAYEIHEYDSVKVGFIGLTLKGTDVLVAADGIQGLTFLPEANAINALIPELEQQGVKSVVVMIHEGGYPTGGYNECPGISGPIVAIANQLHENVGVILSGHTHQAYNCKIGDRLVTSAASNGRLVTDVEVVLDKQTKTMLKAHADNVIVTRTVAKAPDQSALIARFQEIAAPIANRVIGRITEDLTKANNAAGESMLGRLIVDAHLAVAAKNANTVADIAFTNPGGIRTDLTYSSSKAREGDANVTFGEAYAVQPFSNNLITMSLTGTEILEALEQQFAGCGYDQNRVLQVAGLRYAYRANGTACEKVDRSSVMVNGDALEMQRSYRVVSNSFLADGGDGFTAFKKGTARITGGLDIDALTMYLEERSPISGDRVARITRID